MLLSAIVTKRESEYKMEMSEPYGQRWMELVSHKEK